ncbi:FecR family protein [Maribellus maritimus]|uniref:FecR family protein n=1 Tax=Maribellus maritimus TaxID=2870838 RepID=UPI001EEA99A7|nr:FecR family protein [Maribellus maritimus]MCG6189542.1 FecR family protein [Maribellus maritimus]
MKNLFAKYFNSTLRPDEFQKITKFIGNKENENAVFKEIKPFWEKSLQKNTDLIEPNKLLFQNINKVIRVEERNLFQRKIRLYSWGLRIAAILVLGLITSTVFFSLEGVKNRAKLNENIQTVSSPYGARTNITLPDGSIVWLNSGTTLSFPSGFGKIRPVKLVGEAYFKVAKSNQPFIVSTQYGEVEVKGTSFNVKAFSDDNSFVVTLEEGIVSLKGYYTEDEVTLSPGQQAEQTTKGFSVADVEPKFYTSWKEGKLIFSKEPFPSLIKKLERWYNVKIEYNDPKLDQIWYTGTIEMESISEVMEMISKASPVSYSFNNKTRVFTIKPK